MTQRVASPELSRTSLSRIFSAVACGSLLFAAAPAPAQQDQPQQGKEQTARGSSDVKELIQDWPDVSKKAANAMIEKYGQPDESTKSMLIWHNNGPWKRTIVSSEPVEHKFPMPHKDVLEQVIDYKVPPEKVGDLAKYDGSVIVERTKGEISARCDKEAANFLALNLAHEIVQGDRDVEGARKEYAQQIKAMMNKESAPLTEGLKFEKPSGDTASPDKPSELMGGADKP